MTSFRFYPLLCAGLLAWAPADAAGPGVVDVLAEYLDFADAGGGAITPAQVASVGGDSFLFIDTRSDARYQAGHVPGARHLEWRRVLAEREQVPRDRSVVLYCDTGVLSAQAHLALRLAGYDNVKVLAGGYQAWLAHGAAAP